MVKLLLGKGAKLDDAALFHPKNDVNIQIIKYLLKRGANPKATDASGNTLLHKQCKSGNLKNVKYLMEHCNADVSAKNRQGHTPLHLACCRNNLRYIFIDKSLHFLKIVKYLIEEQNADPVVNCDKGKSALNYAAEQFYSLSILRYLIQHQKLDIEATDSEGKTALHLACQSDDFFKFRWETQEYLIEEHAKIIEAKDKKGNTALYYCLDNFVKKEKYEFDNFRPIALILATKAKIWQKQENKDTDHIFDWMKQSYDNDMKKSKGEDEAVSCLNAGLQSFQKQLDKKDQVQIELNPLLLLVCYCNTVDIAKYMFNQDLCYIEKHFNAEEANSKRKLLLKSYLKFSCQNGLLNLISFLFQEIKNRQEYFQHLNFDGRFLRSACINKHIDIFKYLLEDEETKDEAAELLKDYPLHFTCSNGSLEMVQYLIEKNNLGIEEQDNGGRTPLHCACLAGSIEISQYLIEKQNANINVTNKLGRSVWHFVSELKCLELVKYISQKTKQDVNAQDEDGSTALHLACQWRNLKVVKFLIKEMKANLNLVDKEGRTPLHVACKYKRPKCSISKLLVNQGANVQAKDKSEKSQIAISNTSLRHPPSRKDLVTVLKTAAKR
jgi:ankyrin repeat protein